MADEFTTVSSRIAYENRWLRVREDRVRRRDGSEGIYGVVERSDFVIVAPVHGGRITLVEQYRYPVRVRLWELPMGTCELAPGATPAAMAALELREETGLAAGRLLYAGEVFQGPGYCSQRGHVFLATDLSQGRAEREASEQDMLCRSFAVEEAMAMVRDGAIRDALTIAALGLLRLKRLL
jgi:8-oxo-dGTP pyrophosphatase MutT (NUDIX family)